MKRIFSLFLAITMIISTLAVLVSCGGDKNPEQIEPRRTVTEEEWIANMHITNYTLNGKYLGTDNYLDENITEYSYGKIFIEINDKAYNSLQELTSKGALETYVFLQIVKDGNYYNVYKNVFENRYEAIKINESDWLSIGDIIYTYGVDRQMDQIFSSFTYDEGEKCYAYKFQDPNNISIKVWFADGVITDIKLETDWEDEGYYGTVVYDFAFSNVGSASIEIPKYTIVEK